MLTTGLILIFIWCYIVQLMEAQDKYKMGLLNPLYANELTRDPKFRPITTLVACLFFIAGTVFCFVEAQWLAIAWIMGMMVVGGGIRDIFGNLLIGGRRVW